VQLSGSRRVCSGVERRITPRSKKRPGVVALWAALMLVPLAPTAGPADDLKAKEKVCTDTAAAWFKKNWPNPKLSTASTQATASYTSHYHTKRNECFILLVVDDVSNLREALRERTLHELTKQLFDPDANRTYATLRETNGIQTMCVIEGRLCKTEAQWDMLVRALYLEDEAATTETLKQQ
jgi:hypothetical protein